MTPWPPLFEIFVHSRFRADLSALRIAPARCRTQTSLPLRQPSNSRNGRPRPLLSQGVSWRPSENALSVQPRILNCRGRSRTLDHRQPRRRRLDSWWTQQDTPRAPSALTGTAAVTFPLLPCTCFDHAHGCRSRLFTRGHWSTWWETLTLPCHSGDSPGHRIARLRTIECGTTTYDTWWVGLEWTTWSKWWDS